MGLLDKLLKKKQIKDKNEAGDESGEVRVAPKKEKTDEVVVEKDEKKVKRIERYDDQAVVKKSRRLSEGSLAHEILISPLVTEKSAIAESVNKYSFVIARWASKDQVARAIWEVYGIRPTKVQTINLTGRRVRFKGMNGVRQDYKKAIITLPKGKSIDIHKGV